MSGSCNPSQLVAKVTEMNYNTIALIWLQFLLNQLFLVGQSSIIDISKSFTKKKKKKQLNILKDYWV